MHFDKGNILSFHYFDILIIKIGSQTTEDPSFNLSLFANSPVKTMTHFYDFFSNLAQKACKTCC